MVARLTQLSEIANEKGLDAQNFQCKGCTRPLGLSKYDLSYSDGILVQ